MAQAFDSLKDLTLAIQQVEGIHPVLAALKNGRAATIDGAWNSSAALAAAALGLHAPHTLLVVLSRSSDIDAWCEDIVSFAGMRPAVFPAWDAWPVGDKVIDEVAGQRLRLLRQLDNEPPRFIVTTMQALLQPVPDPTQLRQRRKLLRTGSTVNLEELTAWLVEHSFQRMEAVELPGEFSRRGGILDVFSPDAEAPYRIEFFGDDIESIRQFAVDTQRSLGDVQAVEITAVSGVLNPKCEVRSPKSEVPNAKSEVRSPKSEVPNAKSEVRSPKSEVPNAKSEVRSPKSEVRKAIPEIIRSKSDAESRHADKNPDFGLRTSDFGLSIPDTGHLFDYLPTDAWIALVEPDDLREQARHYLERVSDVRGLFSIAGVEQQTLRFPSIRVTALPSTSEETTCHLRVESVERFSGEVSKLRDELDATAGADRVLIACHNEAERKRLTEVFAAGRLAQAGQLHLVLGRVAKGFRLIGGSGQWAVGSIENKDKSAQIANGTRKDSSLSTVHCPLSTILVLSDHELFHREAVRTVLPRRQLESRAIDSFLDLAEGDLVVHLTHGIARYRGMKVLEKNGRTEEHLILEFREGLRVYVPASKIDLVQKYVGGAKTDPELSKVGGTAWQHKKEKVQAAVMDLASEMVELQALRESKPGNAYPPDSEWQAEFEAAFPYEETADQLTTLGEIKRDMERPRPMDRLICGDVGYGKTELAIRAAFKAIDNGEQVAVLVPTTVLAEQHFRTFSQRLAEYPFVVECISRFKSAGQQKRIIERLARGGIDIIIGTHRLVSPDIRFKQLGLVVIDEEQRFGVEHKERLKRLRQTVDVLTLTATPIPRTLHLSLLGIRDISNLETPPKDRLAIETRIVRFDPQLIRHAIVRELNRDGQVYFVHNRVYNIHDIVAKLQQIVPEARIVVGHGQMHEHELEESMVKFVRRDADILVATTIIESGLDIPNVNTIFIHQADNYGLADLHQLRGRVGRYKHRAYAYMLIDGDRSIAPQAARRLKAIEEFTELGAGFKIAMRDLEIRGAGNILGTQQSGHIAAVGYELYCHLLENAVRQLKNQPLRTPLEVNIDLPWPAVLPRDYVPGQRQKIEVYRRLARIRRLQRLEDFRQELRDRFGAIPEQGEWLVRLAEVRLLAAKWQIVDVHLEKSPTGPTDVVLGYRSPRKMAKLAERSEGRIRVVDSSSAFCRLRGNEDEPPQLYGLLKHLLRFPERQL